MSSRIAFDLETVRNEKADEWFSTVPVKAPSNYKDEDKIKAYEETARKNLGSKAALTWNTGKALSFSCCDIDSDSPEFFWGLDETALLRKITEKCAGRDVYTKSGKLFDFPFLVGRFMVNKVPLPAFLVQKCFQFDVDEFFSWSASNGQRMSLDAYAHGLGIGGKDGSYTLADDLYSAAVTGCDTTDLVKQLEKYNNRDVQIVVEMTRRYYGIATKGETYGD